MPYADADFILALLKPRDWLKSNALKVLKRHKGKIWTSLLTIVEVLMVGRRLKLDPERLVANILEICQVAPRDAEVALRAAVILKRYELTVFDAFHAAIADGDAIISSDARYQELGMDVIPLR